MFRKEAITTLRLGEIAVRPDQWRLGIGSALVDAAIRCSRPDRVTFQAPEDSPVVEFAKLHGLTPAAIIPADPTQNTLPFGVPAEIYSYEVAADVMQQALRSGERSWIDSTGKVI
jgi:GNAT superfamily N-acetyltransferase